MADIGLRVLCWEAVLAVALVHGVAAPIMVVVVALAVVVRATRGKLIFFNF